MHFIYYDRRHAGWSQYDAEPFTLADLAADAAAVLDHLQIERADVIATSAGGPIGLRLALDQPERVQRLALLNTGAALMSLEPQGMDFSDPYVQDRLATVRRRLALVALLEQAGEAAAVQASEAEWRTPPDASAPAADRRLEQHRQQRTAALQRLPLPELTRLAAGALRNMQAYAGIDLSEELAGLRCPTLVVHGDADTTVPHQYGVRLAAGIRGAEFVTIPDAGHGLIVQPDAQQIVSAWLR